MQIEHLIRYDTTLFAFLAVVNFIHEQVANLIIQHTSFLINLFLSITRWQITVCLQGQVSLSSLYHQKEFLSRPVSVVHRDRSYLCVSLFLERGCCRNVREETMQRKKTPLTSTKGEERWAKFTCFIQQGWNTASTDHTNGLPVLMNSLTGGQL